MGREEKTGIHAGNFKTAEIKPGLVRPGFL